MGHHNSKPGGVQREAYVAITNMTRYVHDRSSSQVLTVAKHAQDIVHAQVQLDYTASKHGGKPFKPARTIKYKWKELKTSIQDAMRDESADDVKKLQAALAEMVEREKEDMEDPDLLEMGQKHHSVPKRSLL